MTKIAAEWIDPKELKPWGKNPRKNDGEPVDKVAQSIQRFGFAAPIVARLSDKRIIAGHTRWKAAKKLKMESVPVRFVDLSDDEADALAIADNRLNEIAPWDRTILPQVLEELYNKDQALFLETGFDLDQLFPPDKGLKLDEPALKLELVFGDEESQRKAIALCKEHGWQYKILTF